MWILRKYTPFLFFLLVASLVIFSWFRFGHMYGGGEVGIPTYDPHRLYESSKYIWWEIIAPGFVAPQSITGVPFYFLLSQLQLIGFSPLSLQIFWFGVMLFLMGFGMYLFVLSVFKEKKSYAIIAGLFYMFNPYMMIQIWHRFVFASFFFVSALPFLALTWRSWIHKGRSLSLFFFILINLLAAYCYGTIAFIITLWLFLFLITAVEQFTPWVGKRQFLIFGFRFVLGLIIWLLTNTWWLIPFFLVGPGWLSQQHGGIGENLFTLINISKQEILPYVLQLINPFHLYYNGELGKIFNTLFFRSIPWVSTTVIFIGLIFGLKQKKLPVWSISFLIIVILSKGVSLPFGYLYQLGFSHFFPLGIIRNPFEKIGILLPFVASILLVIGLAVISKRFNKNLGYIILILILSVIFIHSWPMFFSKVFGTYDKPNFVEIPQDYPLADQYISKKNQERPPLKRDGKILHLPLTRDEAVTYKWKYGYRGVENSALIFKSLPSISHGFTLGRIDDSLTALSLIFNKEDISKDKILEILQDFNVEFIVLHKDVDWFGGEIYDPANAEKIMDNLDFLKNKKIFGDLIIYEIKEEYYQPRITLSNNFQLIYPIDNMTIWPWLKNTDNNFITPQQGKEIDRKFLDNNFLIFPKDSFLYNQYSNSDLSNIYNSFNATLDNQNNILSQLSKIKDNLFTTGEIDASDLLDKLILGTKELFIKTSSSNIKDSISVYDKYIDKIFEKEIINNRLFFYINKSSVSDIFQQHIIRLTKLEDTLIGDDRQLVSNELDKLNRNLVKNDLLPIYTLNNNYTSLRSVQIFDIPIDSKYELLMTDPTSFSLYKEAIDFQINNKRISLKGSKEGDFISFNQVDLSKGVAEITHDNLVSSNLFPSNKLNNEKILELGEVTDIEIPQASAGSVYNISFEYQVIQGEGFKVLLVENTDQPNKQMIPSSLEEVINSSDGVFLQRSYNDAFQNYSFTTPPLKVATNFAKLRFLVLPSGVNHTQTRILIKSPKIERVLNNTFFLQRVFDKEKNAKEGEILEINKKNPTLYLGKVNISVPSFIFLNESFHPGWKLTLSDGINNFTPSDHFLGNLYSNAWFVEKKGIFDFKIEFTPQQEAAKGLILSVLAGAGFLIFLLVNIFLKKNEKN